jgi:hypothetical protein
MSAEEHEAVCAMFRAELPRPDMRPSPFAWTGSVYQIRWSLM